MKTVLSAFLLFTTVALWAQKNVPPLERTITISFQDERLVDALRMIQQQGKFVFSYNSNAIDASRTVTASFNQKTVREILDELFSGAIEYKARSKYIILTKAKATSKKKDESVFSGYVIDEATGERLRNVSVYDPVTLTSSITDAYGYFQIKIDKPASEMILAVNRLDYADTTVVVARSNRLLNIKINKERWANRAEKLGSIADNVGDKIKRFWQNKILLPNNSNIVNIRDTIYRDVQFSLIPFVGTNHKLSGNVINDYSFNLFGGYSLGNRKFELGGLFNIERGNVEGGQIAGLFNTILGNMEGAQIAGLFNANYGETRGVQIAGLSNINWNGTSDASIAGLVNLTRLHSRGGHIAGLANFTLGEQHGGHVAGLVNFATRNVSGSQVAGLLNFTAKSMEGSQVGGLLNFTAKEVVGSQVAGVFNFSGKRVRGSQVAGVLNYATRVKGSQVGLVNISDSIQGVPIGLFSFSLKGYHKLEISADEVFYTNVAFRTGVNAFYNIFTAGAKPNTFARDQTYWHFGYGIGTAPKITSWLDLNIDVTSSQVMYSPRIEKINLLNKFYLGFDFKTSKAFSITTGVTLNGYVTDSSFDGYAPLFTDYVPSLITNRTYSNDINLKMWWGAKVGIRFF